MGNSGNSVRLYFILFFLAPKSLQMVIAAMKLKDAYSLEGKYGQSRQHIKKQWHYFVIKCPSSQGYGFSSSHVWMWELDSKESWVPKNGCFWAVVLKKILENPLDFKEIQPVHSKDQSWVFIGRTNVETETPILFTWCEELTQLKRPRCWERLKAGGEGDRAWDGWMASPIQWTWVWENSGRWWWTVRPGMLQFMGSQRVGHKWETEMDWTEDTITHLLECQNPKHRHHHRMRSKDVKQQAFLFIAGENAT